MYRYIMRDLDHVKISIGGLWTEGIESLIMDKFFKLLPEAQAGHNIYLPSLSAKTSTRLLKVCLWP